MKHLLLTIIAAVVLVGRGESQQSVPAPEAKPVEPVAEASQPEPPTAKAPDIPLWEAAKVGNIEAVKQHLAAGADLNPKQGRVELNPLCEAAGGGHKEIVELLIAAGADVNAKSYDEWTPLHFAALSFLNPLHDQKGIVELLIAKGADVNAKHRGELTPLYYVISGGHSELVELFLANGVDLNAKDFENRTPLDWAIDSMWLKTAALLRKHGGKRGSELPLATLFEAVKQVDLQGVKDFLAKGADVNAKDTYNRTPLHCAVEGGHKEIAELLIAKGADVNAKSSDGVTPLHYAANYDRKEIAELLITNGADVNAKEKYGETPLNWAILLGQTETTDLLRKHGGKTGEELEAGN